MLQRFITDEANNKAPLCELDGTLLACTRQAARFTLVSSSPLDPSSPTEESCSTLDDRLKENVLRCSGTPRISGKLFTGLSVGRTAALCIIVIQTGKQTLIHPLHRGRTTPPPSRVVEGKKITSAGVEARLCSSAASSSLLPFLFPGMLTVSCRAELFWSESDRLPCPFSAAGVAGSDVTAAETEWGPMGAQKEDSPTPTHPMHPL